MRVLRQGAFPDLFQKSKRISEQSSRQKQNPGSAKKAPKIGKSGDAAALRILRARPKETRQNRCGSNSTECCEQKRDTWGQKENEWTEPKSAAAVSWLLEGWWALPAAPGKLERAAWSAWPDARECVCVSRPPGCRASTGTLTRTAPCHWPRRSAGTSWWASESFGGRARPRALSSCSSALSSPQS